MASPSIASVGTALGPHYADQRALLEMLGRAWRGKDVDLEHLAQIHRATTVKGRYLALPVDAYAELGSFAQRNAIWTQAATALGEEALRRALKKAGCAAGDISHLFFATVTGIAVPSIDALLANRLGLAPETKRTPLFGLGCAAGAAGLARAADYLRAFDSQRAALLSVELCSLTYQREDISMANLVASGLFGDGAAAVVLEGTSHRTAAPHVIASASSLYPGTERVMGWDVVDTGFKVVLSPSVPSLVRSQVGRDVDAFLRRHGLSRRDVRHWIVHTGGPKVLDAFAEALELPGDALHRSRRCLAEVGNLSSASVLFVLADLLDSSEARPGEYGLLAAMGPGFCAELLLLQW